MNTRKDVRLAHAALLDVIDGKYRSAERHLKRLHDECGIEGIQRALIAWCDTYHAHADDGTMTTVTAPVKLAIVDSGNGHINPDPPPRLAWAGRLIAARLRMDEDEWQQVLTELDHIDDPGSYLASVLETVGMTIRSLPRGWALMGDAS